jgi:glycosyltransferase 2 family protein
MSRSAVDPSHQRKGRFPGVSGFSFRLVLTGGLFLYIWHRFNLSPVLAEIEDLGLLPCLAGIILLILQIFILGYRWHRILCASDIGVRLQRAFCIVYVGLFFNQCLPTSLGGDGVRVLMLRSDGTPIGKGVNVVLVDRLSGLAGLIPFLLCGTPFVFGWTTDATLRTFCLAATLLLTAALTLYFVADQLIGLASFLAALRPISAIAKASAFARGIVFRSKGAAGTAALAVCTHFVTIVVVVVLAGALGTSLSLAAALVLVPPVIVAAMLPISFAGWGTREIAMSASLSIAGVPPTTGLTISIVLGFILFLTTLPGAFFWLFEKRLSRSVDNAFSGPPDNQRQACRKVRRKSQLHPPR